MEQKKIDRINELARLAKERELTPNETSERETLRREYLDEWKRSTEAALKNVVIRDPDGTEHKLKKKI